ncbi:amidohydrolase family protein [Pleionea sediminis]|uniref:amidohydrolase family protein n=1 Tax=Pleionea sediminis TaxID=2569479 RepID=UPI0011872683|nr:amidohydrolase family protein [Pleionea sediminis]
MRKFATSIAISLALFTQLNVESHTPMESVPELRSFKQEIQDWEDHRSFYADETIDIVDMHLHPGSFDKLGPKGREFVLNAFPLDLPDFLKIPLLRVLSSFQLNPYGAFIGIKNECRKASANNCILFATYAPETWGIEPNEDLLGYLDDNRNSFDGNTFFYGLASISVANWDENKAESLANLETALMHPKVVGIKLAFAHTLTPFNDPKYFEIYEVAKEHDKPIYHHVGTSPLRKVSDFEEDQREDLYKTFDPMYLEDAIRSFPEVKFIMGHAGNDANREGYSKVDEVFYLAENYSNVYIEISALGNERSDPTGELMDSILMRAKEKGLVNRLIYGSDGPGSPGNTQTYKDRVLESLERVAYSYEEAQQVMAGNARKIFKMER